ncbi:hypothetical protein NKR23_g7706 [Pleurostoma richardsiae]|uniref:Helicase C-terminal domain-containing protein n=1 Tax=Pleurostoma richardsiae TaxID=41990 RepID=A0AA38RAX4_9PEZI|nr:hypothetical protein NKR23_g7706 [Pleurostoma richardsiae]
MANLLGYHIAKRVPNVMPGLPKVTHCNPEEQLASSEMYRSFRAIKSVDYSISRHKKGEEFVADFIRCNTIRRDTFEFSENVVPVSLSLPETILYLELEYSLHACGDTVDGLPDEMMRALNVAADNTLLGVAEARRQLFLRASCDAKSFVHQRSLSSNKLEDVLAAAVDLCKKNVDMRGKAIKEVFDQLIWLHDRVKQRMSADSLKAKDKKWRDADQSVVSCLRAIEKCKAVSPDPKQTIKFGGRAFKLLDVFLHGAKDVTCRFDQNDWSPHYPSPGPGVFTPIDWYKIDEATLKVIDKDELHELAQDKVCSMARKPKVPAADVGHASFWEIDENSVTESLRLLGEISRGGSREEEITAGLIEYIARPESVKQETPDLEDPYKGKTKEELNILCRRNGLEPKSTMTKAQHVSMLRSHDSGKLPSSAYRKDRVTGSRFGIYPLKGKDRVVNGTRVEESLSELIQTYETFRELCELFATDARGYFYIQSIMRLNGFSDDGTKNWGNIICDTCLAISARQDIAKKDQAYLLPACGHIICRRCKEGIGRNGTRQCPVADCKTNCRKAIPTDANRYQFPEDNQDVDFEESSKIKAVVQYIKEAPEKEQSIVFVQYEEVRGQVASALTRAGISYLGGRGELTSEDMEEFKKGVHQRSDGAVSGARVLILRVTSIEAAGVDLINAQNIMFVGALNELDQRKFGMFMRQAKGRCLRRSQKKRVYIWHFCSKLTIEERIFKEQLKMPVDLDGPVPTRAMVDKNRLGIPAPDYAPSSDGAADADISMSDVQIGVSADADISMGDAPVDTTGKADTSMGDTSTSVIEAADISMSDALPEAASTMAGPVV